MGHPPQSWTEMIWLTTQICDALANFRDHRSVLTHFWSCKVWWDAWSTRLRSEKLFTQPDSAEWQIAMKQEFLVIKKMATCNPVFLPHDKKTVKTKWVFSQKTDSTGNVIRYRARLVAKGFSQTDGIHYAEVVAPLAKYTSVLFLIALKVMKAYEVLHLTVKSASLNGMLSEEIYVEVPDGLKLDAKSWNCFRLRKALYGLKQVARVWHEKLNSYLNELRFYI